MGKKKTEKPVIFIVRSPYWTDEWYAQVLEAARGAGRAICGAKTKRRGTLCSGRPITGGSGRCQFHGGRAGRKPTGFLYTRIAQKATAIIARAELMLDDPDLLDMKQEIAALKALLSTTMDRVDAAHKKLGKYEEDYWDRVEKMKGLTKVITVKDGDKSYTREVEGDESKRYNKLLAAFLGEQARAVFTAHEVVKALEKLQKLEIAREYVTTADRMEALVKAHVTALFGAMADEIADDERLERIEKRYRTRIRTALGADAVFALKAPEEEVGKEVKH